MNHQSTSPSSSTHSLSQSHSPHLHSTTQSQLNFAYPILQHPTTTTHHHHHQQLGHYNDQVFNQQSYSHYHHPATIHDSMMMSAPPENSMYSSYMRSSESGRTLRPAGDDETSSALHHHYHHPAGILNEYTPRETASSNIYTSQHDSGYHHQYEVGSPIVSSISRRLTICLAFRVVFFEFGTCTSTLSTVVVARNYRSRPISEHWWVRKEK